MLFIKHVHWPSVAGATAMTVVATAAATPKCTFCTAENGNYMLVYTALKAPYALLIDRERERE